MPGPIVLRHVLVEHWLVECRLCGFRSEVLADCAAADQVADDHAGAVHPERDEPEDFP